MQKAEYLSTTTPTGGRGKYPLSTQTLDFIQTQIMLLQNMGYIGGGRYIVKQPDGEHTGIVFIDGECFTLAAKPTLSSAIKFVNVETKKENIKADGETYTAARVYRTAVLSATSGAESYAINDFATFKTNQALAAEVKQMPSVVLNYLQDVLAEKLPRITREAVTQKQLDALREACVMTCDKSVKIANYSSYGVMVVPTGADSVQQTIYLPDGRKLTRYYTDGKWVNGEGWQEDGTNTWLDVKTASGIVYIRHGELPAGAKIIMLRKKRRSAWRRTGGAKAYTQNRGKRMARQPKRQYVHYKGVELTTGKAGEWYVPKCVAVANPKYDSNLINKEFSGICHELIRRLSDDNTTGEEVYRVAGLRNLITSKKSNKTQNSGYIQVGMQVVTYNSDGSRNVGGEILKLKYHLRRKRVKIDTSGTGGSTDGNRGGGRRAPSNGSRTFGSSGVDFLPDSGTGTRQGDSTRGTYYRYVYYRSFSIE